MDIKDIQTRLFNIGSLLYTRSHTSTTNKKPFFYQCIGEARSAVKANAHKANANGYGVHKVVGGAGCDDGHKQDQGRHADENHDTQSRKLAQPSHRFGVHGGKVLGFQLPNVQQSVHVVALYIDHKNNRRVGNGRTSAICTADTNAANARIDESNGIDPKLHVWNGTKPATTFLPRHNP